MKRFTVLAVIIIGLISAPISSLATPLDEVKNLVRVHYKGEIPSSIEEIDSIDDIMEQLDPYSTYFTREEFEAYTNSINNTTTGIGVTIEEHVTGIQIVSTFDGGAAQQAGISPGDIILSINGISTTGMAIQQASSIITGKEGTTVQVQVLKSNNTKEMYNLMRKKFTIPVVTKELLAGNIGYIGMNSFSDNGAVLVQKAKVELQKLGATSFILDLRNNGGGYVHTAEELIGLFPNSPDAFKIIKTSESTLTKSTKQSSLFPANTKVLINGYSASASEMTAAALLDQKSASLYGQKTYGKGSMQSFFSLSDGSILKLTIANFTGPKDTIIHKTGVNPHFVTEVGHELVKAHRDALIEVNKNYKKMSALHNVPTTKQFTITFSSNVVQNAKQKVELVKLGTTDTVPVTIELKSPKQFVVTPTAPLEKGAAYLLLIHPTFQTNAGIMMKNGAYVEVTVQP
ncbi:S41 family peptidase [Psychrobacillus psychrodurans]|uniref:S41 family peptidase n=1 Tax=Psychrobacillus psychrodurans TaxID=126157 RepID=UPI0008F0F978|nr:S41 family peptidase [Psychrobacillus psychrodurans]MCZ8539011.1 S41 family peptidase [Psychrobacillus psychrodurans]SFM26833.1 carboxyl-terminal processing protease [Psychrobacillus psychrodurans]